MAISFESHVVSDLCLGKPALKPLPLSSSLAHALLALKSSDDSFISVWDGGDHNNNNNNSTPSTCVGKISMVDVLSFLCKEENLSSPVSALQSPVSLILPKTSQLVKHVHPQTSLLEAIGLILEGAQNLVVPIQTTTTYSPTNPQKTFSAAAHGGQDYCWLTQEDLVRFILSRIGVFTPTAAYSIQDLGIIRTDISAVDYHSPASLALDVLTASLSGQAPVAVIDEEAGGALVGEISLPAFAGSDESAAAAIMALSCGDLMAYLDSWGGPPEYLIRAIKSRLKDNDSEGLLALLDDGYSSFSSSSDDEDSAVSLLSSSPLSPFARSRRHTRSGSCSSRMGRRAEELMCHPGSSLVAVMIQAIAHRASYVWVVDESCGLVGIVTFSDLLEVFYEDMKCMFGDEE